MRRQSDMAAGTRTGDGRRARDRLVNGESPATTADEAPPQLVFVGDDLRQSGLALGKIEHDLMQVQAQLADPGVGKQEIEQLLIAIDFDSQIDRLDRALAGLRGAIARLRDRD